MKKETICIAAIALFIAAVQAASLIMLASGYWR